MSDLMIWYPIGTANEVRALGLPLNVTASCSLQTPTNRGCAYFSRCRFREIRDGAQPQGHKKPLAGPENVAVYVQLSKAQGGAADVQFKACFDYYVSGLHQRWRHMVESESDDGEVVKLLGVAGNGKTYAMREQVKMHVIKDPNCQACATNTCYMMKTVRGEDGKLPRRAIPSFPRAAEALREIADGMEIGAEVREEMRAELEAERMGVSEPMEEAVGTGPEKPRSK